MESNRIHILHTLEKQDMLDKSESKELFQLLKDNPENQQIYNELNKIWEAAEHIPQPNTDLAWQKLKASIHEKEQHKKFFLNLTLTPVMKYGIAASFLLIGLSFLLYPLLRSGQKIQYATAFGEVKQIDLPDGTHVYLNQNSTIGFEEKDHQRQVKFEGEAYFQVAKNAEKPFQIVSIHTTTEVLGTAFHLLDRKEHPEAFLRVNEGRVKFSSGNSQMEVIGGENAQWINQTLSKETSSHSFDPSQWEKGNLNFDNQLLSEVFAQLEVKFGTSIRAENQAILQCRFSGSFRSENLQEVRELIAKTMGLSSEIQDGGIIFKGEGCSHE